jgi:hypothetical protein
MPPFCLKPFATNLSLKVSIDPSKLYFFLNTYLQPIGEELRGRATSTKLLFDNIKSILSFTASF